MDLEEELRKETEKWLGRIREIIGRVELLDEGKKDVVENVRAYVKDCEYFLGRNDLIRAFESVIWAWAWLEILKELGVVSYPHSGSSGR